MMLRPAVVAAALSLGIAACGDSRPKMVCPALQTATISHSQCGPTADFTPVNRYKGDIADVQLREDAVVLINGSCTGTLIAAAAGPVVLTAGHCVGLGDRALLAFNVEADPDGDPLVTGGMVFEQSTDPDYALIRLDQLPVAVPTPLTSRASDELAVIQHPRGGPKVIAEGEYLGDCHGVVSYGNLDTLVGSSGAGVLTRTGTLLAVHVDGDCGADGSGSNQGFDAVTIVAASPYLVDADIADR
jgi:hypothetical protein